MNKYNIDDIVRIIGGDKYLEMFGVVTDHHYFGEERTYEIDIIGSFLSSTTCKESHLEAVNYNRKDHLAQLNHMIMESEKDHPGVGTIAYEDLMENGGSVKWRGYYLDKYFAENIENGLPPWRGNVYNYYQISTEDGSFEELKDDTLPPSSMCHLLKRHGIRGRARQLIETKMDDPDKLDERECLKYIANKMKLEITEIKLLLFNIYRRIVYGNGNHSKTVEVKIDGTKVNKVPLRPYYPEKEVKVINHLIDYDKNLSTTITDHFPYKMTDGQIMQSIKEAYEGATKIEGRKYQANKDKNGKWEEHEALMYEGKSKGGIKIHFYFDFITNQILTAYPVYTDTKNKPDVRHPNKRKSE